MINVKKLLSQITIGIIFLTGCSDNIQEIALLQTYSTKADNWYSESISVLMNESIVTDQETCSRKIIAQVLNNSFPTIRFSFEDTGYPNELSVRVYTSKKDFKDGNCTYRFDYVTDFNTTDIKMQNNIKDNPETFRIEYK